MIIKECKIPDLSDMERSALSTYMASSLAGKRPADTQKPLSVLARLVDKARDEYLAAREAMMAEEAEGKLSSEEIRRRDQGQFIYTPTIINHLENSINALGRVYKVMSLLPGEFDSPTQKSVVDVRNAIEHIDTRIVDAVEGPLSLSTDETGLTVEIAGETLQVDEMAGEIRRVHGKVLEELDNG